MQVYLYWKYAYNRGASHTEFFFGLLGKLGVFLLVFKTYNIPSVMLYVAGFIMIVGVAGLGHLDIVKGVADRENSLGNQFNPELQRLLKQTEKAEETAC